MSFAAAGSDRKAFVLGPAAGLARPAPAPLRLVAGSFLPATARLASGAAAPEGTSRRLSDIGGEVAGIR